MTESKKTPQIKICGLTNPEEAAACAALSPDAIGLVFFQKSPRNVSIEEARAVADVIPSPIQKVGVFVNETFDVIMERAEKCRLTAIQLHGKESPELVSRLKKEGLIVIKGLYMESEPSVSRVSEYTADAYLVECAKGALPGGNALSWNFRKAKEFGKEHPFIVAGGLTPENVENAVLESLPDAVDVSSGVESSPGRKDIKKIKTFIEAVKAANITEEKTLRRIF